MDCLLGLHSGAPLFLYIRWGEITEILEKSGWVIVQKERTLNFSFKCYCTDLKARILFQLVCWHHLLNSKDAEKEECKGRIRTLCLMSQNLFVHQLWWIVLNRKRVASRYAFFKAGWTECFVQNRDFWLYFRYLVYFTYWPDLLFFKLSKLFKTGKIWLSSLASLVEQNTAFDVKMYEVKIRISSFKHCLSKIVLLHLKQFCSS